MQELLGIKQGLASSGKSSVAFRYANETKTPLSLSERRHFVDQLVTGSTIQRFSNSGDSPLWERCDDKVVGGAARLQ